MSDGSVSGDDGGRDRILGQRKHGRGLKRSIDRTNPTFQGMGPKCFHRQSRNTLKNGSPSSIRIGRQRRFTLHPGSQRCDRGGIGQNSPRRRNSAWAGSLIQADAPY